MLTEYAGTCAGLSQLGPKGTVSFKGSVWVGTDMCCYFAVPRIYHGTATVNVGNREAGRGGGAAAFLPRARDDSWAREGGGEG